MIDHDKNKSQNDIQIPEQVSQHQELSSPESTIKRENKEIRLELQNKIKKISYASYLIVFVLGILISAIYLMVKVEDALSIFDDIYQNWANNFIVDIYEKQDGVPCEDKQYSSNLFQYKFYGSKIGCFCEKCSDKNQFTIFSLIKGQGLHEEQSIFNSLDSDYDRRARARIRRRRRLEQQKNNILQLVTQSEYTDVNLSDFDPILSYKILGRSCSNAKSLDKTKFFQDINSVDSMDIDFLLGGLNTEINLCVTRSKDRNFFSSNLNNKGKCSQGQILCKGIEKDKSYSFCINNGEKCPIRSFHIVPTSQVNEVKYVYEEQFNMQNGYTVLISRKQNSTMPISEINLYESDGPCIVNSNGQQKWRLSDENILYNPLINQLQSFKCKVDTRYIPVGFLIQKKNLYNYTQLLQNMINAQYPKFFLPQQKVFYELFYRNYIKFSSSCKSFLDDVQHLGNSISQIEKISISISVTSSVLCIFQIVDVVYIMYIVARKPPEEPYPIKKSKWFLIIYSILKYPLAFSLCILDYIILYKMVTCRELGQDIIVRKCTDDITSQQFATMRDSLSFYGIFFHIIICFCFWSADIDFMNLIRENFLMKQKKLTLFDEFFSLPKPNEYTQIQKKKNDDGIEMQNSERKVQDSLSEVVKKASNQSYGENQDNSCQNHSKLEQEKSNRSSKISVQKQQDQEQQIFVNQQLQEHHPQFVNHYSKKQEQIQNQFQNSPNEENPQNSNNNNCHVENDLIQLEEDNSFYQ
ncbi:transmembrane protein, putative (macronuclear) [Tetrahymena thermophila SB210]|uniref:Transmembrane protein, putative n=1 Tax=Tetrahymena thermophila (strain SB210) TaxID=312017 RepID=Q248F5_TETTS|nr:transmembrane protein, putative [Tetrahymena thermophila SB210]EAS04090.2 transmembrane protein, putative [Tetrahymena thermophila SB210]|eukprot:XP_001024335.2 transmembrane protein, putative [Tetrahymena thermophila SB210]